MRNYKKSRGELWMVDLDPAAGHEQAKKRPCLIVSATTYNQNVSELVVILPITSKFRDIPWFVMIPAGECGLPLASYIMCNQVRTVSLKRFTGHCLGMVPDTIMQEVEKRLRILMSL